MIGLHLSGVVGPSVNFYFIRHLMNHLSKCKNYFTLMFPIMPSTKIAQTISLRIMAARVKIEFSKENLYTISPPEHLIEIEYNFT